MKGIDKKAWQSDRNLGLAPALRDFFSKPLTKKEQLFNFIRDRGRVRSSDVLRWGVENYSNRADRTARDLATEGRIWRIREDIKIMVFGKNKEEGWSVYPADRA